MWKYISFKNNVYPFNVHLNIKYPVDISVQYQGVVYRPSSIDLGFRRLMVSVRIYGIDIAPRCTINLKLFCTAVQIGKFDGKTGLTKSQVQNID